MYLMWKNFDKLQRSFLLAIQEEGRVTLYELLFVDFEDLEVKEIEMKSEWRENEMTSRFDNFSPREEFYFERFLPD